jgi:hypothetical protein
LVPNRGSDELVQICRGDRSFVTFFGVASHSKPVPVEENDLELYTRFLTLLLGFGSGLLDLSPQKTVSIDDLGDLQIAGLSGFRTFGL